MAATFLDRFVGSRLDEKQKREATSNSNQRV
jgi:hypothetical protein